MQGSGLADEKREKPASKYMKSILDLIKQSRIKLNSSLLLEGPPEGWKIDYDFVRSEKKFTGDFYFHTFVIASKINQSYLIILTWRFYE